MSTIPRTRTVWFAVLGGAAAWVVQFVANLGFTFAQCDQPTTRWMLPVHGWEVALSGGAVAVTVVAWGVSLQMYRRTRADRRGDT